MATNPEKSIMSIDNFHLLLLNIGFAEHHADWNWKNVSSPFSRIYLVTDGNAELHIYDKTMRLTPGHLYMIPTFVRHSYSCESDFKHFYMHIYEDGYPIGSLLDNYQFECEHDASKMDEVLISRLLQLNPTMQLPHSNPATYDNDLTLRESVSRNKHRTLANRVESRGILYQLVSRFLVNAKPKEKFSDMRIRKAVDYIKNNINSEIWVDDLASNACLSKDHFIRLFKKETGETPLQYANRKKIERAQLHLITDDRPVKNIAYDLGFDDHSYFIRLFKKMTGKSPQEYRKSSF